MISSQRFRSPYPAMQRISIASCLADPAHRCKWSHARTTSSGGRARPTGRTSVCPPSSNARMRRRTEAMDDRASQTRCEGGPCRQAYIRYPFCARFTLKKAVRLPVAQRRSTRRAQAPPLCAWGDGRFSRSSRRDAIDNQAFGDMHGGIGPCSKLFGELVTSIPRHKSRAVA